MTPIPPMQWIDQQLGANPFVRFEQGQGGLHRLVIDSPQANGELYLHGGHLTHWQPQNHQPVLWLSSQSRFESNQAIRGGIPICFPWFGSHPKDTKAPSHGLARIGLWQLLAINTTADGDVVLELGFSLDTLESIYTLTIGSTLTMTYWVQNKTNQIQHCEIALHSYFQVHDIHTIEIQGLENTDYVDKFDQLKKKNQGTKAVVLTGPTDRVYQHTQATCLLCDPGLQRQITIEKTGTNSTIVWNPWFNNDQKMTDFDNDGWRTMCCIETANVGVNALCLEPDQTHTMSTMIKVEKAF